MIGRCLVLLVLLSPLAAGALAQNAVDDALSEIRAKTDISDADRTEMRSFITTNVGTVNDNDPVTANDAVAALRSAYAGSDAFKSEFGTIYADVVANAYRRADTVPAVRLLSILGTFRFPGAQRVLFEALQDERVGVRAAASVGMDLLRENLAAAGSADVNRALDALRQAGADEKSTTTLRCIYAAMDYCSLASVPEPQRCAEALLQLIETRASAYTGDDVPAIGAEDVAMRLGRTALSKMDEDQRRRLTAAAGTILKRCLERYLFGQQKLLDVRDKDSNREIVEVRNGVERTILLGEQLLAAALAPQDTPDVLEALRRLDTAEAQLEWKKWNALLKGAVDQDFALSAFDEPTASDDTSNP